MLMMDFFRREEKWKQPRHRPKGAAPSPLTEFRGDNHG